MFQINWHDSSIHPEIIVDNNTTNFSIADMTDEIVALASRAEGEVLRYAFFCLLVFYVESFRQAGAVVVISN